MPSSLLPLFFHKFSTDTPAGRHAHQSTQTERIRSLETKCSKLEDDYRSVAGARDHARKQVAALESERARLQKELADKEIVLKERDSLREQMATRTSERDTLQSRCDRMKKGLQSLLGQDDALLPAPAAPTSSSRAAAPLLPTQS
jgi:chromosome segregation ATPase